MTPLTARHVRRGLFAVAPADRPGVSWRVTVRGPHVADWLCDCRDAACEHRRAVADTRTRDYYARMAGRLAGG